MAVDAALGLAAALWLSVMAFLLPLVRHTRLLLVIVVLHLVPTLVPATQEKTLRRLVALLVVGREPTVGF
jgi:hypothetical protein